MHITESSIHHSTISHVTKRERQILQLLSEGYSSKEIGSRLFISPFTVETHKRNLMVKMNARNVIHLVVLSERLGYNRQNSTANSNLGLQ